MQEDRANCRRDSQRLRRQGAGGEDRQGQEPGHHRVVRCHVHTFILLCQGRQDYGRREGRLPQGNPAGQARARAGRHGEEDRPQQAGRSGRQELRGGRHQLAPAGRARVLYDQLRRLQEGRAGGQRHVQRACRQGAGGHDEQGQEPQHVRPVRGQGCARVLLPRKGRDEGDRDRGAHQGRAAEDARHRAGQDTVSPHPQPPLP